MEKPIKILAFTGSLRKDSFNKALIRAAIEVTPENVAIEVFDLEGIPPFNQEFVTNPPQRVVEFKEKIRNADALLIATPEYNYSIPGVLKNAIDYASRPNEGRFGGARAQYHLRQTFVFLNMQPVNRPEVMLSDSSHNVDADGKVTNEQTRQFIRQLLEALAALTVKLKQKPQ